MKNSYLIVLVFCLSQILMAQTMKIYKNDGSSIEVNLSELDSLSITDYEVDSATTASKWVCFTDNSSSTIDLSAGIFEQADDGVKIYGLGAGYNESIKLMPASVPATSPKTIYLKWKINGNSSDINIGFELYSTSDAQISLGTITESSLEDETWYYTRIYEDSGSITALTSKGNYDTKGGEIISSSNIAGKLETFSFQLWGGKSSYATILESRFD